MLHLCLPSPRLKGGYVSDLLAEKLSRIVMGYDINRYCAPAQFPAHAVNGPVVLLVDENTSSGGCKGDLFMNRGHHVGRSDSHLSHLQIDGDVLANTFRQMGRGVIVGKVGRPVFRPGLGR